ncbi:MAG: UDP-N-acetylmuramoylalanine--D-glutamate ligase [Parcubacteria group bacterium CG1_02_44_65]|uniref:UDP-N-acetylmuramoylalanine--D-glutamate ligase n=3 Tax=Candidatus Portnoyibacteriota TaxID=1817913 RepID=A0A2M7YKS6_9BACT|nr:MAG: UDP-N-acetylmuramoylalanine--D-glutamate ligase [Parcubacteria group bacterium CG1_02_44_65]PIP15586.1 MAG: UDP-N-acetylmuramoyl-L-alanine--D-glutamate ligase [Candidatus Portnoybacteria bacterium CG23_combo_of_CG06-09_8_20_14_all_44_36]PIZ69293.1 MAG: UDP-N-acetylmuramoyl-L-alanine--D-glutamate ligase [Candidatus Portnoybacteria bacterium CG_4_10_14_0_2_um_filter_43_36]PJA63579.1 MAG: UDP-N-acetylmuramoyl-L-alanine--D-glutamate ligase [Candidatus Portnoybacteria bacterium CG_4_9_14_3_um
MDKKEYSHFFKDKKITLMGLGLLGRGINVAKFLAKNWAPLTITDLKTENELKPSLKELKRFKNIKYVLGRHRLIDFRNRDIVIKAAGVPFDSPYIKEAEKNEIPVEMDASLFAKISQAKIIGITGTRGKSTVTDIIYQILKSTGRKVFLGGNVRGIATLPLLEKIKPGVWVVLELDSWQLHGFGDSKISPHIAVFTNFLPDHLNYYRNSMKRYFSDKANIFKYQTKKDYLIVSRQAEQEIKKRFKGEIKSRMLDAPDKKWLTKLIGRHNQVNISLAAAALTAAGIKESAIAKFVKNYAGLPGRMEFVGEFDGIKYYNDTNATTPEAAIAALQSFKRKVVLIAGGSDKNLDFGQMAEAIKKKTKALILVKGAGTERLIKHLKRHSFMLAEDMNEAIKKAREFCRKGDTVLLSPGAASFGVFKNEYDRGEQFNYYVQKR